MAVKKLLLVIVALTLATYLLGCGKKQQSLEEMQEPMSLESLGTVDTQAAALSESKAQATQAQSLQTQTVETSPATESRLESLPPAGPYKPTNEQIQTALKNAGYYTGSIDGKVGPLTKRATEEFQKANNLGVDGKVGPKTWAVLGRYLNPEPAPSTQDR